MLVRQRPRKGEHMLNKAMLIGRLGRDPEMRYLQNGTPVCSFSMATTEKWSDKQGQKQESTEWHKIVVWAKLAELCGQYLTKGRECYVEGKITTREFKDKNGQTKYTTEIVASSVKFLGGGQRQEAAGGHPNTAPEPDMTDDSDIPF